MNFLKRPRFTLRTLFVVVTIFGCWLGYQLNWIRQRREVLNSDRFWCTADLPVGAKPYPRLPLSLRILGESSHSPRAIVLYKAKTTSADREQIQKLFPDAPVMLGEPPPLNQKLAY